MKKSLLTIALITLATTAAYADGFVCETQDGALKLQAYNHVDPSVGTRNPAILILSDNTVQNGRKTIATFEAGETLNGQTASYTANVDLRYKNSNRGGEYLLTTRLGELKTIELNVDFSYASPLENGSEVSGILTAEKRNGDVVNVSVDCTRYLKN